MHDRAIEEGLYEEQMLHDFLLEIGELCNRSTRGKIVSQRRILQGCAQCFESEGAFLAVPRGKRQLVIKHSYGLEKLVAGDTILSKRIFEDVINEREPYVIAFHERSVPQDLRKRGINSMLATSCRYEDRNGALVIVNRTTPTKFGAKYLSTDGKLARIVSCVLHHVSSLQHPVLKEYTRSSEWSAYLSKKRELLEEHRGEYAWIVGTEIRAVCANAEEVCKKLLERPDGPRGVIVEIEEIEPATYEVSSPEVE